MKRQNLKNKEIDQIGSNLLKVTKTSNEEIEKVVANPQLFNSIKTRIKADEQLHLETKHGFVNWNWLKLSFINQQAAISAVAILVVFVIFSALIVVRNQESMQTAEKQEIVKTKIQPKITKTESSLQDSETESEKDFASKSEKPDRNEQIISKKEGDKSSKHTRTTNSAKPQYASAKSSNKPKRVQKQKIVQKESPQVAKKEPQKIFYSLPFAENDEIGNENLQIVSTELSRSELFALGVNLQFENETSTVETELLVGDDGVARAIRVVEKY